MRLDLEDADFRGTVARWLRELDDETIVDLNAVFEQSPGVYPTTLIELWRLELSDRNLRPVSPSAVGFAAGYDDQLPVGHPVDADWRFTPQTADELAQCVLNGLAPGTPVVHIGAPSTFLRCMLTAGSYQHILIDRNATVIDALIARGIDSPHMVLGVDLQVIERLHLSAGAVIVDPPWYVDDTLLFLAAAASACRSNATIALCQPTSATRPGISQERTAMLDRVSELGLQFYALRSGVVRYVTPHFEAVSLRAAMAGTAIPIAWRRGDLLLFKRGARNSTPIGLSQGIKWQELAFGPVRIKLAEWPTGADLGVLVQGDVLTNVSRRDPIRDRIGMWTSGNRVFTVADPPKLGELIKLCNTDLMNGLFSLQATLMHAADLRIGEEIATRLYEILSIEAVEHDARGGRRDD